MIVYEPNLEEHSYETAAGEVFIIDLVSGHYYTLEDSAVLIWQWLIAGAPVDEITAALAKHYELDAAQIGATVSEFVAELERRRLIIPSQKAANGEITFTGAKDAFETPVLQVHEDARDFVGLTTIASPTRLQPAHEHIVSEVFEDEALILDMRRGVYYALPESARIIWEGISRGASITEIVDLLLVFYKGQRYNIENKVIEFANSLLEEKLVIIAGNHLSADDFSLEEAAPEQPADFPSPTLQKYTDIENLLLLDPIHEVDGEKGWPDVADD